MSSRPVNRNPATATKRVEAKPSKPQEKEVPIINVEKAQIVQKEEVDENMSISESFKALIPTIGLGLVLILMFLSFVEYYYRLVFG